MILPAWTPLSLVGTFAALLIGHSFWTWKRFEKNPFSFGRGGSLNDFMGRVFGMTFIGTLSFLVLRAIWPSIDQEVGEIRFLARSWIEMAGLVVAAASFLWTAIAEFQMGALWRIGIPSESAQGLISSGLFSVSRNPVFLGMLGFALGLLFLVPTILTLSALVVLWICFNVQVRLEEAYLQRMLGAEYADYCSRVRRWL